LATFLLPTHQSLNVAALAHVTLSATPSCPLSARLCAGRELSNDEEQTSKGTNKPTPASIMNTAPFSAVGLTTALKRQTCEATTNVTLVVFVFLK
jgi:V8-like Glu-specific endopeptidase